MFRRPFPIAGAALALVLALAAGSGGSARAESPALKAKQAEASAVLNEISALDERLSVVTEQYDGARYHLQTVEKKLQTEKVALARARQQSQVANQQVAKLLVSLYTTGQSSTLDALLGATSFAELLKITDEQTALSHARNAIATSAKLARARVQADVEALRNDRAVAARSVREIGATRRQEQAGLAQRQRLLASVKGEIAHLQAVERARQERLLAEARARMAAEERAAKAAAAARAAAAAKAEEQAQAAAAAQAAATTTDPTSTVATTVPTPTTPLPAGYPQAAAMALDYIGVPYLWGGASPSGFDCSGLVMYIYAQLGIQLPHFAAAQYTYGVPVPENELEPGDLVFFDNLDHVGIYIGANEIVDAPHTGTYVRIDSLSDPWYSSHYFGARRL